MEEIEFFVQIPVQIKKNRNQEPCKSKSSSHFYLVHFLAIAWLRLIAADALNQRAKYRGPSLSSICGGKIRLQKIKAIIETKANMTGAMRTKNKFFQIKIETSVNPADRTVQTRRMLLPYSGRTTSFLPQDGQSKGLTIFMRWYGNGAPQTGQSSKCDLTTDVSVMT
jgi:hypothetical protein